MLGPRALQKHVAAGHRRRHGVSAGLDTVRLHAMLGAVEPRDSFDLDRRLARAGDFGAHFYQKVGEIHDLGFARRVMQNGGSLRQSGGHQRDMGAPDGDLGKDDFGAAQALRGLGDDIAGVDLDVGAEALKRHQEKIDRPCADGAATRQRNPRFAAARQQRRDDPETGAHARNQLIGGDGVDDFARRHVHGLAGVLLLALTATVNRIIDAMIGKNAHQQADIGETRQVFQRDRAIRQQRGDHQRQRRVLGPGNRNRSIQRSAADNPYAIHCASLWRGVLPRCLSVAGSGQNGVL